jgi:transcriptional regulator with XRE-family HTH domain
LQVRGYRLSHVQQAELARRAGIRQGTLAGIEQATSDSSVATITKIDNALKRGQKLSCATGSPSCCRLTSPRQAPSRLTTKSARYIASSRLSRSASGIDITA